MKHDAPVSPAPQDAGVPSLDCGSFDKVVLSRTAASAQAYRDINGKLRAWLYRRFPAEDL
jgi:hypothetical protein